MPPHMEKEPKPEQQQFESLEPFTADDWKFKLHPTEFPIMLAYTVFGIYGGYIFLTSAKFITIFYTFFSTCVSMLGVAAGAHRLWCHKTYKAKLPLQIFLAYLCTMSHQRSIMSWVKRHRHHHKYSDTDADPHNPTRGFFFAQFGWLMVKPHPKVVESEKLIDISDMMKNPVVRFEYEYYTPLCIFIAYAIPTYIPTLWGETLYVSYFSNLFRVYLILHLINMLNSFGHLIGYKPIDTTAAGTQFQFLGILLLGEGFHNYHHSFPYDYRGSELGDYRYNPTTSFINFMAKIGQAYDLRTTSDDVIRNRVLQKGDGTDMYYIPNNERKQDFFCTHYYEYKKMETSLKKKI